MNYMEIINKLDLQFMIELCAMDIMVTEEHNVPQMEEPEESFILNDNGSLANKVIAILPEEYDLPKSFKSAMKQPRAAR